jgi:FkbM family methyltransferase
MALFKPKYYSQHGEDYLLDQVFQKDHGYFVDIGAFDGKYISNSYFFEQLGWKGVCVEPNPDNYARCVQNRPNTINIHAACTREYVKEVEFYVEPIGLYSRLSVDDEQKVKGKYTGKNLDFSGLKKIVVEGLPLTQILQNASAPKFIDWVSIDVEGAELGVLQGLDFNQYSVGIFIIEATPEEDERTINPFMKERGYQFARRILGNVIYCKSSEVTEKIAAIPIRCKFANVGHPLGDNYHHMKRDTLSLKLLKLFRFR